jgi:hypothetical protein
MLWRGLLGFGVVTGGRRSLGLDCLQLMTLLVILDMRAGTAGKV